MVRKRLFITGISSGTNLYLGYDPSYYGLRYFFTQSEYWAHRFRDQHIANNVLGLLNSELSETFLGINNMGIEWSIKY